MARGGGWCPDWNSRYFTEDIPFGTRIIQECARQLGIPTPTIDFLVSFITSQMPAN